MAENAGTVEQHLTNSPKSDMDDFMKVIMRYIFLFILVTLVIFFIIDSYTTKYCEKTFTALATSYLDLDPYSFTFLYFVVSVGLTVVNFPMTILVITGGYIFDKKFGLALGLTLACFVNILSFTVGAMICFCLSLYCFRDASYIDSVEYLQGLDKALQKNGFTINILLRLTPILPGSVMNYALPALGTNFCDFSMGAFLGTIPYTILMTTIGALIASNNATESQVFAGLPLWVTITAGILGILLLVGTVYILMVFTVNEIDQIKNEASKCNVDDETVDTDSVIGNIHEKNMEEELPLLEAGQSGV